MDGDKARCGEIWGMQTYLVLKFRRITPVDRHGGAIHMQLSDDAAAPFLSPHQLRPERALVRALPQAKKPDEDVSFRVFV